MKKFMSVFWLVFVSAAFMLTAVFSANAEVMDIQAGELTISGEDITVDEDYTYTGNVLTILSSKEVTISGTTTKDRIVVKSENGANITLSNVNISNPSGYSGLPAFDIAENTKNQVIITLDGKNILTSGSGNAGLQKSTDKCKLIIQGKGELEANGGEKAAGIGGGNNKAGSNITITSGTVTANGGRSGAGIGGGLGASCSYITISGGTITAKGSFNGAGIGGGGEDGTNTGGSASNITISGGTVNATSGGMGAGIGGGKNGDASSIMISGGTVTAISPGSGAGIGGGGGPAQYLSASAIGRASDIIISGGTVTATSYLGAGIGAGGYDFQSSPYPEDYSRASNINISGGEVTAINTNGLRIGIGSYRMDTKEDEDTVYIKGESETHCPIVYTNSINSKNSDDKGKTPDEGGYWGIVFEGPETASTKNDFKQGFVYGKGKTVDLSKRDETYVLGAGKRLTVLDYVTFKPSNKFELNGTSADDDGKSVLYLNQEANLEYWYEMTKNEYGEIQHEHSSTYGWYYSDEEELYDGAKLIDPALWDEVKHLYINDVTDREGIVLCNICGKPEPHPYDITADWQQSTTHHWHEGACNLGNDCAVTPQAIAGCSYTSDGKLDNGKHKYNFEDVPEYKDGKWIFKCTVCEYETPMEIPVISLFKVDGENNPLAGAEFGLYSDAACTTLLTSATSAKNGNKATAVFGSDFGGGNYIKPGNTYYIKETKAPEGYTLSDKVFAVSIAIVDGEGKVTYGAAGSEEPPVCENIANVPDEPEDPENPEDPKDPENPDDPKPSNPTPDNPTPDNPTPDNPTPDNPTPDDPTPDPDDNDNPNTGVGFGIAGLMLLGGSLCVVGVSKRRRK